MNKENIHNRILNLSDRQRRLLKEKLAAIPQSEKDEEKGQLTAYVLADDFTSVSELRSHVKERLPEYMVPANFVLIDEFPLLPNGKIDQKALASLKAESEENTSDFEAPKTEIEQKLAAIWESILGFSPIGIHDNFFEVGGDSILSIQITSKARREGIILEPNQIFEFQTISELSAVVQSETNEESEIQKDQSENGEEASDFSESGLNQSDLDELLSQL